MTSNTDKQCSNAENLGDLIIEIVVDHHALIGKTEICRYHLIWCRVVGQACIEIK